MWFVNSGNDNIVNFWINAKDFAAMIDDISGGNTVDEAYSKWKVSLDTENYRLVDYVEDAIKEALIGECVGKSIMHTIC